MLVGEGSSSFCEELIILKKKDMLTDRAKIHFHNRLKRRKILNANNSRRIRTGHDTVGMVGLDVAGDMVTQEHQRADYL